MIWKKGAFWFIFTAFWLACCLCGVLFFFFSFVLCFLFIFLCFSWLFTVSACCPCCKTTPTKNQTTLRNNVLVCFWLCCFVLWGGLLEPNKPSPRPKTTRKGRAPDHPKPSKIETKPKKHNKKTKTKKGEWLGCCGGRKPSKANPPPHKNTQTTTQLKN